MHHHFTSTLNYLNSKSSLYNLSLPPLFPPKVLAALNTYSRVVIRSQYTRGRKGRDLFRSLSLSLTHNEAYDLVTERERRMGRAPCCSKVGLHRGPWTAREDTLLINYIQAHGEGHWRSLPRKAGIWSVIYNLNPQLTASVSYFVYLVCCRHNATSESYVYMFIYSIIFFNIETMKLKFLLLFCA